MEGQELDRFKLQYFAGVEAIEAPSPTQRASSGITVSCSTLESQEQDQCKCDTLQARSGISVNCNTLERQRSQRAVTQSLGRNGLIFCCDTLEEQERDHCKLRSRSGITVHCNTLQEQRSGRPVTHPAGREKEHCKLNDLGGPEEISL